MSRGYERPFRFLAGYAVWLAGIQVGLILLSLLHVRIGQPLAIGVLLAAAAAGVAYGYRGLPRAEEKPETDGRWSFLRVLMIAVVGAGAFLYVAAWIGALAKPDLSWDGNSYHIPMIHLWARRGYIHWIAPEVDPGPEWGWLLLWLFNSYPKGAETISFAFTLAAGTSHPVNTCNLAYLPLGVAGITVAARRLGASPRASLTAGAAFALVPVVVAQGGTVYVDAALGCGISALVGAFAEARGRIAERRPPWEIVPALASSIALAATAKSSGIAPALLAVGLLFVLCLDNVRRADRAARKELVRKYGGFLAATVGAIVAIGGYWYIRSWVHTGNPLSPVRVSLLGHTILPGVPLKEAVSEDGLTSPILQPLPAPVRVAFTWLQGGSAGWPESIQYYDTHQGGLGFLWLFACVPAIIWVGSRWYSARTWQRRGEPIGLFPFVLIIVGVSYVMTPMNWWARYTMWLYALGLPCLALLLDVAAQRFESLEPRLLLRPWLAGLLALLAWEGCFALRSSAMKPGFLGLQRPLPAWTPAAQWRALTHYDHPAYFYYNMSPLDREVVTSAEAVAVGPMTIPGGPLIGVLSMPVGLRDLTLISSATANDPAALRRLVEEHHVRYIFWPDDGQTPQPILDMAKRSDRTIGYWRTFDLGGDETQARLEVRAK